MGDECNQEDLLARALLTLKHTHVGKDDLDVSMSFREGPSSKCTLQELESDFPIGDEGIPDARPLQSTLAKRKKDTEGVSGAAGCNCRKSKCLKLYCQCFSSQRVCLPSCSCVSCANTRDNEQIIFGAINQILERNPNAFQSKFGAGQDIKGNLVCVHKLGCRCRKSMCLKKYCECYHRGVFCTVNCSCSWCRNIPNAPPLEDMEGEDSSSRSESPASDRVYPLPPLRIQPKYPVPVQPKYPVPIRPKYPVPIQPKLMLPTPSAESLVSGVSLTTEAPVQHAKRPRFDGDLSLTLHCDPHVMSYPDPNLRAHLMNCSAHTYKGFSEQACMFSYDPRPLLHEEDDRKNPEREMATMESVNHSPITVDTAI